MKIKIIGAGFSGLTTAYYFLAHKNSNLEIEVIEKSSHPGGMIQSHQMNGYLYETAANAILCNHELEELCKEIGISIVPHLKSSKNRYIFVDRFRKFPLSLTHAIPLLIRFFSRYFFYRETLMPLQQESVEEWSLRHFSKKFLDHLIEPALQGIYAARANQLSASLIFSRFFQKLPGTGSPSPQHRGSVSFEKGLGDFLRQLATFLQNNGVKITYDCSYSDADLGNDLQKQTKIILCTHAHHSSRILQSYDTQLAKRLSSLKYNDLCSATVVLQDETPALQSTSVKGFGVLFPRDQNFSALGVLFPNFIFPFRGPTKHETWIIPASIEMTDEELLKRIRRDRQLLYQKSALEISTVHVSRWPKAIPNYDLNLENFLADFSQKSPVFLHGNYLGEIGLGKILLRSKKLAEKIVREHKMIQTSNSTQQPE
jgi:oxygen-dependent protoporphyrinogen oxidase